ncbi:hypothetical protein I5L59_14865 [Pseudomonas moraviensis]|uniref:hypothetical protein n=1 Tax=Pseudomonas moraviensis TaxID=321662 RepID=UPI0018D73E35|nr:hypothetical protein [Pseudomonas moraviensis]MBH3444856.1 hypothetical protein [Pseudomonas moraviensis]
MKQYDWPAWRSRIKSFTGKWALERWFLMHLHEQRSIDALALEIKSRLAASGRSAQVRVQSIWVDGTPQAEFSPKGHSPRQKKPQCELADLLLCVRWESPNGLLQREQAMLIQAKVASKYNKLPGGKSTQKERLLFEDCNRHKKITLYPGVNRENPIGSYQLGASAASKTYGLEDCASFLLMAKSSWPIATAPVGPLQVGWPLDKKKTVIKPPDSYLDAVISMVSGAANAIGREVKTGVSAKHCVWTKMVNDLRGKYETVSMKGYNGQARVITSASSASARDLVYSLLGKHQHFSDFVSDVVQRTGSLPKFMLWFGESEWRAASKFKMRRDPHSLKNSNYIMAFMEFFCDWDDPYEFDIWKNVPVDPPPQSGDFNDAGGPYLPTVVITVRSDEEYQRPD